MSNSARPSAINVPPHSVKPHQNHDSGISMSALAPPAGDGARRAANVRTNARQLPTSATSA